MSLLEEEVPLVPLVPLVLLLVLVESVELLVEALESWEGGGPMPGGGPKGIWLPSVPLLPLLFRLAVSWSRIDLMSLLEEVPLVPLVLLLESVELVELVESEEEALSPALRALISLSISVRVVSPPLVPSVALVALVELESEELASVLPEPLVGGGGGGIIMPELVVLSDWDWSRAPLVVLPICWKAEARSDWLTEPVWLPSEADCVLPPLLAVLKVLVLSVLALAFILANICSIWI